MKLANAFEPVQDGPTCVYGLWTLFPPSEIGHRWPLRATSDRGPFLYQLKGTPVEYKAGLERAIAQGWLWLHESGTYVKFMLVRRCLRDLAGCCNRYVCFRG
jgi:hypothetical protein